MDVQIRKRLSKTGTTRYQAVIEVWNNNKRQPITVGTYSTEREAQREGDRALSKYETDIDRAAALRGKTTLREWAAEWLISRKGKIKDSSRREYGFKLNNWVLPYLGDIRLSELSSVHIRRWLDHLPATKNLGSSSVDDALTVLRACLSGAVRDGALTRNPAQGVKAELSKALANEDEESKPVKVWSHEEAQKLLAQSEGHKYMDTFVTLGLLAGLRPGEIDGLKWEDIDFLNSTVTVRRANKKSTSTKSGKSRTVNLPFEAVRRLMALQEASTSPWVFPMTTKTAARHMKLFCELLGVNVLPPHSLRHTFASLLISAGVPITAVAKILGHSTPEITLRVYAHALPKDVDQATSVLERVLNVAPTPIPTHERIEAQVKP